MQIYFYLVLENLVNKNKMNQYTNSAKSHYRCMNEFSGIINIPVIMLNFFHSKHLNTNQTCLLWFTFSWAQPCFQLKMKINF